MKIYHYTKYNTFINKIFRYKQLKFGDLRKTNDPSEFIRFCNIAGLNLPVKKRESFTKVFFKELFTYKTLCFSIDYNNRKGWQLPCMWAHYGNNHKGICIEIDIDLLPKTNITNDFVHYNDSFHVNSFKNELEIFEEKKIINEYIVENTEQLFFKKECDWKIEQEYRFISNSHDYLDITNAITAVYLGVRNFWNSKKAKSLYELLKPESIELYFIETKNENDRRYLNSYELESYIDVRNRNSEILRKLKILN